MKPMELRCLAHTCGCIDDQAMIFYCAAWRIMNSIQEMAVPSLFQIWVRHEMPAQAWLEAIWQALCENFEAFYACEPGGPAAEELRLDLQAARAVHMSLLVGNHLHTPDVPAAATGSLPSQPSTAIINPAKLLQAVQPWETWGTEAELSQSAICTAISPNDETKGEGKGDRGVKGDETEVEDNFKGSN